jgi:hypothetical protein
MKKIDTLQKKYNLKGSDEVSKYHEMWWREEIDKTFPDIAQDAKEGLLQRWAFSNKSFMNFREMTNVVGKEGMEDVKAFDKKSAAKYKENIRPFEDLFLEFGSAVLMNASNFVAASPDAEMQRLHNQIPTEGLVFKYNGKIYKLTGTFAAINQLMGIIKYGR